MYYVQDGTRSCGGGTLARNHPPPRSPPVYAHDEDHGGSGVSASVSGKGPVTPDPRLVANENRRCDTTGRRPKPGRLDWDGEKEASGGATPPSQERTRGRSSCRTRVPSARTSVVVHGRREEGDESRRFRKHRHSLSYGRPGPTRHLAV